MVDLIGSAKDLTGLGTGGGIDVTLIITILALIVVFGMLAGGLTWWIVTKKSYRITIKKWERINGRFQEVGIDKGKVIPIGGGGDSAIFLKKHKKILPMPVIQTGINTYWYFVSDDGEWINFGPSDFDEDRKVMGAQMLDREMRYARTSLQALGKERYNKTSFLEKYGGMIAYAALIIVTAVGFWLLIDKMLDVAGSTAAAMEASKEVMKEAARLLGSLDNLKGGSGIVAA